ncbi:hypothetical protein GIB67_035025 [Kingdonia uniflora]|uniref:Uncharacterized protein n=1 Tax=Kingdonia uniflora TaxID=39325 RepID=A0A7J7L1G4_9MAGN|nr:hypothetical protein GIB67_035025 [Kingdonia uniflora]
MLMEILMSLFYSASRSLLWVILIGLIFAIIIQSLAANLGMTTVLSVSGDVCSSDNLTNENKNRCSNLNLNFVSFLLENALRRSSSTIYAIALLASGQNSPIMGTYAGQYIMQGFLNLKMKMWVRNLMTQCIAIIPSLIVYIIAGFSGAGQLIIIASMILSFDLPFALMPLLKFSSSQKKLGPHKSSIYVIRLLLFGPVMIVSLPVVRIT